MFAVIKTSLRELVIIIVQRKKDQRYKDMDKIIRLLSDYEELNKQNMIIAIFAMYMSISFEISPCIIIECTFNDTVKTLNF